MAVRAWLAGAPTRPAQRIARFDCGMDSRPETRPHAMLQTEEVDKLAEEVADVSGGEPRQRCACPLWLRHAILVTGEGGGALPGHGVPGVAAPTPASLLHACSER